MTRLKIDIDDKELDQLKESFRMIGEAALPNTLEAFRQSAKHVEGVWKAWVRGEGVVGIPFVNEHPNAKLANTIRTSFNGSFNATISSNSKQMENLVNGTPEYDMKNDAYLKGKKSRVSKKGLPYLIIPFRWGTPGAKGASRAHFGNTIQANIYRLVVQFQKSKRTKNTHIEPNAKGQPIERSEYKWGDRLEAEGEIYNGMVRMNSGRGSSYFTFRIISASQIGTEKWVRKARPGIDITNAVIQATQNNVLKLMEAGIQADLS